MLHYGSWLILFDRFANWHGQYTCATVSTSLLDLVCVRAYEFTFTFHAFAVYHGVCELERDLVCVGAELSTRGWSVGASREAKIAPSFSLGAQACGVRLFRGRGQFLFLGDVYWRHSTTSRRCDGRRHAGHSASVQGLQGVRPKQIRRRRNPAALQRVSPIRTHAHAPPPGHSPQTLKILNSRVYELNESTDI